MIYKKKNTGPSTKPNGLTPNGMTRMMTLQREYMGSLVPYPLRMILKLKVSETRFDIKGMETNETNQIKT